MHDHIVGPLISTGHLQAHAELLGDVFGMQCLAEVELDDAAVHDLWGVHERTARTALYQTPGTETGIRLVQFDPVSEVVMRDRHHGDEHDALKVIDFFVPDFAAAVARLEDAGHRLKDAIAEYDLPEGHFREAHLWAVDEVVYALIAGPAGFMAGLVHVVDRPFSEVMSLSTPVTNRAAAVAFYRQAFGFDEVYRYGFDDASFANLVGSADEMRLTAINVGTSLLDPYFGLIDYGPASARARSLANRCQLPHRGLAAAVIYTDRLKQVIDSCRQHGHEVVAGPAMADLPPHGIVPSALIRAPHGVLHHVIEPGAEIV
jgi:catechol 2,3-dioxygenase-like lactoylglutathione lyase family enzyme